MADTTNLYGNCTSEPHHAHEEHGDKDLHGVSVFEADDLGAGTFVVVVNITRTAGQFGCVLDKLGEEGK